VVIPMGMALNEKSSFLFGKKLLLWSTHRSDLSPRLCRFPSLLSHVPTVPNPDLLVKHEDRTFSMLQSPMRREMLSRTSLFKKRWGESHG
jgi:hypothetical protein